MFYVQSCHSIVHKSEVHTMALELSEIVQIRLEGSPSGRVFV